MHVDKTSACAAHKTKSFGAPAGAMDDSLTFPIRRNTLNEMADRRISSQVVRFRRIMIGKSAVNQRVMLRLSTYIEYVGVAQALIYKTKN